MSSCAASFSMCCRAASIRCVTSACGIPRNATTQTGSGRCCNSRRHPRLARHSSLSSRHSSRLAQRQCHRSSHASVRTVITGGWSSSARSRRTRRNKPWHHDRQRKPPPPSSGLAAACLDMPRISPVTNAARCPDFAPKDTADRPDTATPDRITAVIPRRTHRLSRGYQPSRQASLVKSP